MGVVNSIKAANLWGCQSGYVRSVAAVLHCAQTRAAVQRVALSVFACSGFFAYFCQVVLPARCSWSSLASVSLLRPALRVRGAQPKRLGRAQGCAPDVLHIPYWLHVSCWLICLTALHNRGALTACCEGRRRRSVGRCLAVCHCRVPWLMLGMSGNYYWRCVHAAQTAESVCAVSGHARWQLSGILRTYNCTH